jgi:hypothetical protein
LVTADFFLTLRALLANQPAALNQSGIHKFLIPALTLLSALPI